jgi:hypothetical protein
MTIGVLALALAMIGGGAVSAFYGWEIVQVERGWTMVIAGSVLGASGALLLGIAALSARIGGVQRQLRTIADRIPSGEASAIIANRRLTDDTGSKEVPEVGPAVPNASLQPELPFIEPPSRVIDPPMAAGEIRIEQDEVIARQSPREDGGLDLSKLKVPDFLLDRTRGAAEPANDRVEPSLDAAPLRPGSEPLPEEPALKASDIEPFPPIERQGLGDSDRGEAPVVSDLPDPDRSRAETSSAGAAPEPGLEPVIEPFTVPGRPATVIGTYNSGDNRYVMFSDGSIEAETPQGNFRFGSLDELKAFIAAGGEGTPGPA